MTIDTALIPAQGMELSLELPEELLEEAENEVKLISPVNFELRLKPVGRTIKVLRQRRFINNA